MSHDEGLLLFWENRVCDIFSHQALSVGVFLDVGFDLFGREGGSLGRLHGVGALIEGGALDVDIVPLPRIMVQGRGLPIELPCWGWSVELTCGRRYVNVNLWSPRDVRFELRPLGGLVREVGVHGRGLILLL